MSSVTQLPSGVEWLHEPEVEEGADLEAFEAVVNFWMPWDVRSDFLTVVGGLPEQFSAGGITYTRIVPLAYPAFDNCYANRVRIRGDGASRAPASGDMGIEYDWARATVWFATPRWNFGGDYPLITRQQEVAAEMVTRPRTAYTFPTGSLALTQDAAVRVPIEDIVLTFHQVQSFDQDLFRSLAGCVNTTTFYGADPGTIQYAGASTSGEQTLGNVTTWTITHKFRWRKIPHNMIMRPDGTAFEAPVDDNGDFMLPTADLNLIFG